MNRVIPNVWAINLFNYWFTLYLKVRDSMEIDSCTFLAIEIAKNE